MQDRKASHALFCAMKKMAEKVKLVLDKWKEKMYYILAVRETAVTWSSIEVVITGTTGNRVYPKRVPRVQIPPAPPNKNHH